MYESAVRILIQKDQIRNPLSTLMGPSSEDPLLGFKEIFFSDRAMDQLIDSLGMRASVLNDEVKRRNTVNRLLSNINAKAQGEETITISYMDSDPYRAQHGVVALTNIFIEISSNVKDEQNEMMVEFYQNKMEEFRRKLEDSQEKVLPSLNERIKKSTEVSMSINTVDEQIRDVEKRIAEFQGYVAVLKNFTPEKIETKEGRQVLYDLQRNEAPYSLELRTLLTSYTEASERYSSKHPDVQKAADRIRELLRTIELTSGNELTKLKTKLSELRNQRVAIVDETIRLELVDREQKDKEQDYLLYQKLYNEIKFKLEEAQMTRAISKDSRFRFVILDPAYLPLFPSKPSRILIILGGLAAGILVGIILTVAAELLDTTIRSPREILLYQRPIIALLPRGSEKLK